MWQLNSVEEIERAALDGQLLESEIFDAKRELPIKSKNKDIAKDVAGMANDGGVLLYGIDEDANGRATVLAPIELDGARERVAQVVATSLAEPLPITTKDYPLPSDATHGYLVVIVPPSPRAPHMVVVDKDYRYYKRTDTSTVPMTEGEVARLYERRHRWAGDRSAAFDRVLDETPASLGLLDPRLTADVASLYVMVNPVVSDLRLLGKAFPDRLQRTPVLQRVVQDSYAVFTPTLPDLIAPYNLSQRGTGIRFGSSLPRDHDQMSHDDIIDIDVREDGTARLFARTVGKVRPSDGHFLLFEATIARLTTRMFAVVGALYQKALYAGPVDIGVAVTGLVNKPIYSAAHGMSFNSTAMPVPFSDDYQRTARVLASELVTDPIGAAHELVMPLVEALAPTYDPFPANSMS